MQNFPTTTSNAIISIRDTFSFMFYCISEMCMKLRIFWTKRWVSSPKYFRNFWIQKRWLFKRLKHLASEHNSVINVLAGSKHCWNQHGTTIFLFFHEFEMNWVGKILPSSDMKSSDCLLTHWLPMTSIPVAICRINLNNFKRHYLKKKNFFQNFLLHFWNVH